MPDGFTGRLSREEWQSFCNNIGCSIRCCGTETLFRIARFVLVAVGYLVLMAGAAADLSSLLFLGLIVLLITGMRLAFRWFVGFTRKNELEALRSSCCAEEDRLFRSRGFVLECEFEWCDSSESSRFGFCVYFLPIPRNDDEAVPETPFVADAFHGVVEYRNGYKRIELFNDGSNAGCVWNPISFSYIPPTDDSMAPESSEAHLWTLFCSELSVASKKILFDFRLRIVTRWLFIGIALGQMAFGHFLGQTPDLVVVLSLLALWLYSMCSLALSIRRQKQKIQLYAAAFEQRSDLIIVDRNVYGFSNFAGLYHIRYLYVYRLTAQQAVPECEVVAVLPDFV
jgi:hypothetical protein